MKKDNHKDEEIEESILLQMSEQNMEIAEKPRKIKSPERNLTGFQTAVGKDKK